ncbi:MAG: hypothetical protein JST00_16910 [Deltaproteobacteria bacterium]|nr:hypothetical protein [Deltaproteobacteria bacterium]
MAVRVVYDGAAHAGKTTNLVQLCTLFAAHRSLTMQSPKEMRGRTLYFDWMQISAGVACGFPLLCQVLTVPGQAVLLPRRRRILAEADVVVYVCESSPRGLAAARAGLALHDEMVLAGGDSLPIVLQANKQDRAGALAGEAIAERLGRVGAPVVEAVASEGMGVVDTFVTAIRAVVTAIQEKADRRALRVPVRRAQTSAEVFAEVSSAEIDPEWAAEMLLEEAHVALAARETTRSPRSAVCASALAVRRELQSEKRGQATTTAAAVTVTATTGGPPLPRADVPTGFVWPAHTGRSVLGRLGLDAIHRVDEVAGGRFVVVAAGHVAETSLDARFADAETARQALVRRARELAQLERLLVPETVLVAQSAPDGSCWIWRIRPELPTVDVSLRSARAPTDILASYATALVDAARVTLRHDLHLDLAPSSFGLQGAVVRHIGALRPASTSDRTRLASAIAEAIRETARSEIEKTALLDIVERESARRLLADERSRVLGASGERRDGRPSMAVVTP